MVINLTSSERSTFYRFLGLYLGSSFILMVLIAFFYFENEKRLYYDLIKSNMQNTVSKISSNIIIAHMTNREFDGTNLLKINDFKISFYDENQKKTFGNLDKKIDFKKDIIKKEESFILVDKSALGHLGVYYIAIEENLYFTKIDELKVNIILFFVFVYSLISLLGFYLAKLFLKPIKEEREKLNNFIKDTTHELNTPISAILMSTEQDQLSPKQIQRIKLSARRISEVYKDLTYIFLHKKEEKISEKINLKDVLDEQLEYFKVLALKKGITFTTNIEDFTYVINRDDFIRIINNLISNAIKYNKTNGELTISLVHGVLKIEDAGIGIDRNKINDIFNRYYRATAQEGGFGIGLSIVSHICKKYNIKITVDSKINKGTTFILKF